MLLACSLPAAASAPSRSLGRYRAALSRLEAPLTAPRPRLQAARAQAHSTTTTQATSTSTVADPRQLLGSTAEELVLQYNKASRGAQCRVRGGVGVFSGMPHSRHGVLLPLASLRSWSLNSPDGSG